METQMERVRIVPLYKAKVAAAPVSAKLTYNGGVLIENAAVYTIFWGDGWSSDADMQTLLGQVNQFFTDILVSPLMDQLAEYNVAGSYTIGQGTLLGTTVITDGAPQPGGAVDDPAIRTALQGWIAAGQAPATTANTLYFVYLDQQVTVNLEGAGSCRDFCGYHDAINGNVFYAVMPYPGCAGCLGGLSVFDALTGTSSHELCEAITDAVPPTGWYDTPNNMEIGDLCAWQFKNVVGYTVQTEWSNEANACV